MAEARIRSWVGGIAFGMGVVLMAAAAPAAAIEQVSSDPTSTTTSLRELRSGTIRGPLGWEAWCETSGDACYRESPAVVALDSGAATLLIQVFYDVHARITPSIEPPGTDVWQVIEGYGFGDCEDFALTWRSELIAAGLPAGALDIAVAITEQGEVHAVLAIQTDRGTIVFDNRQSRPRAYNELPYAWLALEPINPANVAWQALPDRDQLGAKVPLTAEGRRD